ncbi:hypothetical protein EXIGLDRAFT_754276 [Exidia glandulosa HHB12029]|uniref:F-box domain-containing protein n=1 Tax=Exidia glandulosa HHB12029 TaxID=1314781 RepID=A0A165D2Z2_EXIGL|nr:hypothetical protein EXIGLDRAFT_754276 [Exidia glandulosa HHB12029]
MSAYPEAARLWLEHQLEYTWATVVHEWGFHGRDEQEDLLLDMRHWCTNRLAYIASRRNAFASPARNRMPPEIWSMIWHLLPSADIQDVARVCHSWRKVAVSDKLLWTSPSILIRYRDPACPPGVCGNYCQPPFSFQIKPGDEEHDPSQYDDSEIHLYEPLATLRNFAVRSGDLPLTVRIGVGHEKPHKKVALSLATAMEVLKSRLHSLHLEFDSMDALKDFLWELQHIRLALPALEHLTLDCSGPSQEDMVPMCTLPFPKMPALQIFEILTDTLEWLEHSSAANLTAVKHLTTCLTELGNLPLVRRSCPDLTSLTARLYIGPDEHQHGWDAAVRWFGGLRELHLDFDDGWAQHLPRLLAACHGVQYLELKQKPGRPTWTAEDASVCLFSIEQLFDGECKDQLAILARHSSRRTRLLVVRQGQRFAGELAERMWAFAGRAREIRVLRVEGIEREVHKFIRTGSQHILKTVHEIRRRDEWSVLGEELRNWVTSVAAAEDRESDLESEEEEDSE